MTSQEHSFLSASVVRELAQYGSASLPDLVPPHVAAALRRVYQQGAPPTAGASDRSDV
jgi:phosphopantetheine adenylyltransferase